VQFSTGGRTAQLTIPAGTSASLNSIGVQLGTVAGTATITAQLLAGSQNVTPTPAPSSSVVIKSVAPVISSMTASSGSTGLTVTVNGFATARSMTQAVFTFTPASGANLQTTSVTVPVSTLFAAWYANAASPPFGSEFAYTQPFAVTGSTSAIGSVSVTLMNSDGTSTAATATVN